MNPESIDTRIGTQSTYTFSHGNTLPLTGVPFGMNYLAVQTTLDDTSWWFDPTAKSFAGIRLTHQPSPWVGDYSSLLFTPLASPDADYLGTYDPTTATFAPHELAVFAQEAQVALRATATRYGGALQLSGQTPLLQISAKGLRVLAHDGDRLDLAVTNFAASEDPDFTMFVSLQLPAETTVTPLTVANGKGRLVLALPEAGAVTFATSFIDAAQAAVNLAPLAATDYHALVAQVKAAWVKKLAQVEVTDHDSAHVALFYHNLYRASLFPMTFYELSASGNEVHYDTTAKTVRPGKLYTNNGFWDTYKTLFPLLSLLDPTLYADMLEGFYNSYLETGFLPRWLSPDERGMMPGTMVDAVIADAAVKGIAKPLMPKLLAAMQQGATTISKDVKYGREGLAEYLKLGYVPADIGESVNKTLDYAYSDWLISAVAGTLGETTLQTDYQKKSQNWRNVFDPSVKLMRAKDRSGQFVKAFTPIAWGNGYTEGSAWQNSFAVYQDIPGLIEATGGKDAFVAHLHHMVNQPANFLTGSYGQTIHEMRELAAQPFGQIAISNQPSFHLPYLFTLAGDSASTEVLVRTMLTTAFSAKADGYPGDEDNGSMSSWVLFSALGFYPVTPGSGRYVLGAPLLDDVVLHLPKGDLHVTAANNRPGFNFVGDRTFNGKPLGNQIDHATLAQGGTLASELQLLPHDRQ
ncbi:GH92 family glycosyl hydrolase [Lacticaseibacillus parakribbianus]|uniref:GH92 family glycosyl hydrolase n=1 Tax=Lacticaseibacillus parakribbianus TaxID=2970927 RepID=UPI0021CB7692|nr:GH92 family glycosyl hydrolase [Lacticaseibacillus parakribbianus]